MKQVLQNMWNGQSEVADVPAPRVQPGCVVVRVAASLVSAGTERMLIEFGRKNLLEKARARPDLVRQALDKARREGILPTLESALERLHRLAPLGYSCAGRIIEVGRGVTGFEAGQAVACAGAGYAVHGEFALVPANFVVRMPSRPAAETVQDFEAGAFATVGAIALQGVRLAGAQLGEAVAVIGLGLLGQLSIQILKAAGCKTIGMDIKPERAQLALELGADAVSTTNEELQALVLLHALGRGADAVLITADTDSNEPVEIAGAVARDRATVVAVGAVGMTIPRLTYYEKELSFRVSRSYGPGRYDPDYEQRGHDYPLGYVRWTSNRNMEAFLALVAEGKVRVEPLITHRFPIEDAAAAYELITGKQAKPFLGVLLKYSDQARPSTRLELVGETPSGKVTARAGEDAACIGLLGAGNFALSTLLPAFKKTKGVELVGVAAATGPSARHCGDKFGFRYCTTDETEILKDSRVNAVVIATRHHLHGRQVAEALNAGKHVFVEKPLAMDESELEAILNAFRSRSEKVLMVGFNRRFASMARRLKEFVASITDPLLIQYRVNAGYLPQDHWSQVPHEGGGRIIGETCHFMDLASWLVGATPSSVRAQALPDLGRYSQDNLVITLSYPNGSEAVITYLANGDRTFGKERLEVHGGGSSAVLEDFRRLELVRNGRRHIERSWLRTDKGHRAEVESFVRAVRTGGTAPVPLRELIATTRATFAALESLKSGKAIELAVNGSE